MTASAVTIKVLKVRMEARLLWQSLEKVRCKCAKGDCVGSHKKSAKGAHITLTASAVASKKCGKSAQGMTASAVATKVPKVRT